jgi:hypothetical protein
MHGKSAKGKAVAVPVCPGGRLESRPTIYRRYDRNVAEAMGGIQKGTGPNGAKLKAVWDVFGPSQGVTKLLASSLA